MRILLIVDCYLPEQKSSAALMHDLADEMVSRGAMVTVLAPSAHLTTSCRVEQKGRLKVVRYRTGGTKGTPLYVRAVNEMLLSATAWARARRAIDQEYDLVVFYSPSIFFGPFIAYLKSRMRVRTYLVLRDIFPDWAVNAGILRKGLAYRVFKFFEWLEYATADRIGVETAGSAQYFRKTAHFGKIELLRNWTRTDSVPVSPDRAYRSALGLQCKTVFLYGGNIGIAQDMDNILRLAHRMEDMENVHFVLIGSGAEVERLTNLIADGEARNVTLLPPIEQSEYLSVIGQFDVGLISLDRRLQSFSTTGKLLGYLRCGLPVLASVNLGNELMELLTGSGAGLCSWNGDDDRFYQNALSLCSPVVRNALATSTRALLEAEFSAQAAASRILHSADMTAVGTAVEMPARN